RRALLDVLFVEKLVDRHRGVVAVGDGPDDVLRAEGGIAAEEDARHARLERSLVENRQAPLVELDARVLLDPREGVLLADRDEDVVAFEELVGLAGRNEGSLAF